MLMVGGRKWHTRYLLLRHNDSEAFHYISTIKKGTGFRIVLQLLPKHMTDTSKP